MDRYKSLTKALVVIALFGLLAAMPSSAAVVTIDGSPLNVYANDSGNLQAKLDGDQDALFFPPVEDEGDAGLFIGISGGSLGGTVFGPGASGAQTAADLEYTPLSQGAVTGTGTEADPYTQVSSYKVVDATLKEYLGITQTVTYVEGAKQFKVDYAVQNITSGPPTAVRFRASSAADLYIEGSDEGTGLLDPGPPRFVAGANNSTGRAGGMVEQQSSPWDAFEVATFHDIWSIVGTPLGLGFDNSLLSEVKDNGVGVQWNTYYGIGQGLPAGQTAHFSVAWKFSVVVPLTLNPIEGTGNVGTPHEIVATASDVTGAPLVGKTVRYAQSGVNVASGTAVAPTNSEGKAKVKLNGTAIGQDAVTVFVDLNGNATREANEPQSSATVNWAKSKPPVPPEAASITSKGPFKADANGRVNLTLACPSTAEGGCEGDVYGRMSVRRHLPKKAGKRKRSRAVAGPSKRSKKKKKFKPGTVKYPIGATHYKLAARGGSTVPVVLRPEAFAKLKKMKTAIVSFTSLAKGKRPVSIVTTVHAP